MGRTRLCQVVALAVLVGACDQVSEHGAQPSEAPEIAAEPTAAAPSELARAEQAARSLGKGLKLRLTQAMGQGGPSEAVRVCSTEAREITQRIRRETGVRVGRSSLRLRNPDNAGPEWVEAWLREHGERPAAGLSPVREVQAGTARFLAPIEVEGLCVTCHGAAGSLPTEVVQVLRDRYPQDRAVGYAPGDLRGALWAEAPVPGG